MLPEGWKRVRLGEIAQVTSGGTPERSEPAYWNGDIPWVTTGEIQFNTIRDSVEKITDAGLRNSAAKVFPPNTLLMAMYGQGKTRGQVAKLGIAAATNQACAAILLKPGYDPDFYFQTLGEMYEEIRDLGNSGTQKNLNAGLIKALPVPAPPLVEQQRLSQVIGTWDAAISKTEILLANSQCQYQALIHKLLTGKRGLSGWSDSFAKLHASEIFTTSSVRNNGSLELLSVTQGDGVVPRSLLERKVVMPEGSTDTYKLVEPGDFIISLRSFEGGLEYSRYRGLVSPAYTVLKSKRHICDDFYRHYFKSTDFISRLSVAVIGIRDGKQISYDDFGFIKLPFPSIEEQIAIAEALNMAEAIIEVETKRVEQLKAEKRALMQQLLTGKCRVPMPTPEFASA